MIENRIKELIISRYGSVKYFSKKIGIPYTTLDSILKRGIGNSNVMNVIKVCDALEISIDSLKKGIIEPTNTERITSKEFEEEVRFLLSKTENMSEEKKKHLINTLNFICNEKDKE